MAWVIRFDGQVFRENDLTIGEAEAMEIATETRWHFILPLHSAKHAKAILTTLLVMRGGETPEGAEKRVTGLKITDYLEMVSDEDDDADLPEEYVDGFPPVAAEPPTTT